MLQSNGDGTAVKLLTTSGTFYNIGRALIGRRGGRHDRVRAYVPLEGRDPMILNQINSTNHITNNEKKQT